MACRIQDQILDQMGLLRSGKPAMVEHNGVKKPKGSGLSPAELASLVKAWESLEDRKRILRGKGLPKPIEGTGGLHKRPRMLSSFSES